jgi:GST-like protein
LFPPQRPEAIQLYSVPTPNGVKVSAALEELGVDYEPHLILFSDNMQKSPEFLALNPNGKIPAIIDPNGPDGEPLPIFESGAILFYLAEKTGRLMPDDPVGRMECLQWLFFQMSGVGPMFGQFGHFFHFKKDQLKDDYPVDRYTDETRRLLDVLDGRLKGRSWILGENYTISDIATFPWVRSVRDFYKGGDAVGLSGFTHVVGWLDRCLDRPASQKALNIPPRS